MLMKAITSKKSWYFRYSWGAC